MSFEILRLEETEGKIIEYEVDRMEKFYWVITIIGTLLVGVSMII